MHLGSNSAHQYKLTIFRYRWGLVHTSLSSLLYSPIVTSQTWSYMGICPLYSWKNSSSAVCSGTDAATPSMSKTVILWTWWKASLWCHSQGMERWWQMGVNWAWGATCCPDDPLSTHLILKRVSIQCCNCWGHRRVHPSCPQQLQHYLPAPLADWDNQEAPSWKVYQHYWSNIETMSNPRSTFLGLFWGGGGWVVSVCVVSCGLTLTKVQVPPQVLMVSNYCWMAKVYSHTAQIFSQPQPQWPQSRGVFGGSMGQERHVPWQPL